MSHRPSISAKNRPKSTVDVDSYQKKSVDIDRRCALIPNKIWSRPSKWTWTQKNREHWPHSPIVHNKKMYMIDSDAHFFSPGPISSACHKTTHKKETNTHRQSVWWTQSQEYFKEELIAEKLITECPILNRVLPRSPGRVLPRSQGKKDHWPIIPYCPISDEKWSRTHIYKKVMVTRVVRNSPNSYLDVDTYPPIYRPNRSITRDTNQISTRFFLCVKNMSRYVRYREPGEVLGVDFCQR